jgi:hypothetical protein
MRERASLVAVAVALWSGVALAEAPTPGYPERVLQWTVKNGETCDDIADALYGSAEHRALLERYNQIRCQAGVALADGTTLVVPEKPTTLPTARLRSLHPDVRARSPGSPWAAAQPGMALYERHSVNTLQKARADILFVDRTRVVLGEHTLVVIYDTAKHTNVARTPPSVELEAGEVQAGLAALRGKPFELGAEGGRVSGASRDMAVRARKKRATVSVFDGSAKVSSSGKDVLVPKNHGTSFRRAAPPTAPRPLPRAPRWAASTSEGVLLTGPGQSVIVASWDAVANSATYRIEMARDAEFTELVLREQVPARVRAFRAEKLPPGAYFLRVRAIDRDDFLGIASSPRAVVLVEATVEGGRIHSDRIEVNRHGKVRFARVDELELALDDGPFSKAPAVFDPRTLAPRRISLRVRGMGVRSYTLSYLDAPAGTEGLDQRSAADLGGPTERLGVTAPIVSPSPLDNVVWWAPTRADAVAIGATGYRSDERWGSQLAARGSGSLGAFGLDAMITTPEIAGSAADDSAWFKLRWRSVRARDNSIELGPAAELGVPLTTQSPATRAGLGFAIGGALERFSWLANAGGRARLADGAERVEAPAAQGYLLVGSSYDAESWLRVYTLLDAHALDHPEHDAFRVRGGLSIGGELGYRVFASLALRASPWDDAGGTLIGQLSVGVRDRR